MRVLAAFFVFYLEFRSICSISEFRSKVLTFEKTQIKFGFLLT